MMTNRENKYGGDLFSHADVDFRNKTFPDMMTQPVMISCF